MMTGRASWIAVVIAVGITACSNPVTSRRPWDDYAGETLKVYGADRATAGQVVWRSLEDQENLHAFLARARNVHPSDLADILSALDEAHRVRVISELPMELASSALAEMEAAEHPEEMLLAVGPEYAAELVEEMPTDDA